MQLYGLFTLGFPSAPLLNNLTSLHTITRRTVLQKVPHRGCPLCVLVNIRFQVLFHSPPGVLFTFPSQYFSTIGHQVVFRLGGWSPHLHCGFHVSAATPVPTISSRVFTYKTLTSFGTASHPFRLTLDLNSAGPYPISIATVVWPLPLSLATTPGISLISFPLPT